jgi:hypothetical protein
MATAKPGPLHAWIEATVERALSSKPTESSAQTQASTKTVQIQKMGPPTNTADLPHYCIVTDGQVSCMAVFAASVRKQYKEPQTTPDKKDTSRTRTLRNHTATTDSSTTPEWAVSRLEQGSVVSLTDLKISTVELLCKHHGFFPYQLGQAPKKPVVSPLRNKAGSKDTLCIYVTGSIKVIGGGDYMKLTDTPKYINETVSVQRLWTDMGQDPNVLQDRLLPQLKKRDLPIGDAEKLLATKRQRTRGKETSAKKSRTTLPMEESVDSTRSRRGPNTRSGHATPTGNKSGHATPTGTRSGTTTPHGTHINTGLPSDLGLVVEKLKESSSAQDKRKTTKLASASKKTGPGLNDLLVEESSDESTEDEKSAASKQSTRASGDEAKSTSKATQKKSATKDDTSTTQTTTGPSATAKQTETTTKPANPYLPPKAPDKDVIPIPPSLQTSVMNITVTDSQLSMIETQPWGALATQPTSTFATQQMETQPVDAMESQQMETQQPVTIDTQLPSTIQPQLQSAIETQLQHAIDEQTATATDTQPWDALETQAPMALETQPMAVDTQGSRVKITITLKPPTSVEADSPKDNNEKEDDNNEEESDKEVNENDTPLAAIGADIAPLNQRFESGSTQFASLADSSHDIANEDALGVTADNRKNDNEGHHGDSMEESDAAESEDGHNNADTSSPIVAVFDTQKIILVDENDPNTSDSRRQLLRAKSIEESSISPAHSSAASQSQEIKSAKSVSPMMLTENQLKNLSSMTQQSVDLLHDAEGCRDAIAQEGDVSTGQVQKASKAAASLKKKPAATNATKDTAKEKAASSGGIEEDSESEFFETAQQFAPEEVNPVEDIPASPAMGQQSMPSLTAQTTESSVSEPPVVPLSEPLTGDSVQVAVPAAPRIYQTADTMPVWKRHPPTKCPPMSWELIMANTARLRSQRLERMRLIESTREIGDV